MSLKTLLVVVILLPLILSQCLPGTYLGGSGICIACPAGTYSFENPISISACIPCGGGSYSEELGHPNCTTCPTDAVCNRGSPRPFSPTELITTIIDPSRPKSAQNWKIGFVFICMLLFVIPLLAFSVTCWDQRLCGFFDVVYQEKHYIPVGDARIKKRNACGGFFFLLAMALFSMVFGAVIVDFYFSNVYRVGKIQPSMQIGRVYPYGNFDILSSVKIVGVNESDCKGAITSTGYNVQIGGSLVSECASVGDVCTCSSTCTKCALAKTTSLSFSFSHERIFAPYIFYQYSVSHFGEWYSVNGSVNAPTDTVFYGSATPSRVSMTLFPAFLHGLQGGPNGGAQWSQWVDTFIHDYRFWDRGLALQVENVQLGTSVANLTGLPGISFVFAGDFAPWDYVVDEHLRQTVWNHIAELIALCLLFIVICSVLLVAVEYLREKYEEQEKAGRVKRVIRAIKRPFRVTYRSVLNLCRKEKMDVWAESSDDEEKATPMEETTQEIPPHQEALDGINAQIQGLEKKEEIKEEKPLLDTQPKGEKIVLDDSVPREVPFQDATPPQVVVEESSPRPEEVLIKREEITPAQEK